MTTAPLLKVRNLRVSFGAVLAVDDLSFELYPRETLAVVGESGSGKSVTALSVMGLVTMGLRGTIERGEIIYQPESGQAIDLVTANEVQRRAIRGNDISMIFQEPLTSLNPVFTIGDQITEVIALHLRCNKAAAQERALEMLERVRIPGAKRRFHEYPHQLSGGMRQRVMIAMALACDPNILIADEPTTALDVTIQAQILSLIRQLQDELSTAVILITHDMGVVAEVADRVTVMHNAKEVEQGRVNDIFSAPTQAYTRRLLHAVPRLGSMQGQKKPAKFSLTEATGYPDTELSTIDTNVTAPGQDPVVTVSDLTKRFPVRSGLFKRLTGHVHAVESISFSIAKGETLALVGESGCGKSTTGNLITRLENPTSGDILLDGANIANLPEHSLRLLRREMQMIFQDPFASLDPRKTAGDSVAEPLLIHQLGNTAKRRERVSELFHLVGLLPEHMSRYPHQFSGGQRQRICIARALALNPKLLIADEAVSALDVSIQAQIINLLLDLQIEFGLSYLFISHDMAVVERISHRVAVMYLGQIVEIGTRENIFSHPRHSYTQRLLSAVPIADPQARNRNRALLTGEIPSPFKPLGYEPDRVELYPVSVSSDHWVAHE